MCIIIAKPAGVQRLSPDYFERAWNRNPDGGGLVWKEKDGEVCMQKGFMKKEEFLAKIDELNQDETAFIAHFRIKSVGAVCAENTHPFVMDHVTYAHNGTLGIKPFEGKTDSETFGLCFLKDKPMSWIKEYKVLLEMALGTSKFAIMDNETGEIFILNSECGKEQDGAWFSNESAFAPKTPVRYGYDPYKGYRGYNDLDFPDAEIKALANWGTKNFKKEYCYLDNGIWHWNGARQPAKATGYTHCAVNKRGFFIINPAIKVPEEAQAQSYTKTSLEVRVAEQMLRVLYKEVKAYHKQTYPSKDVRTEAQCELSAVYTVIRAMYLFIQNKKKIDEHEFLSFLLDNTESDTWLTKVYPEYVYGQYVSIYAGQVLAELEKGRAKKA